MITHAITMGQSRDITTLQSCYTKQASETFTSFVCGLFFTTLIGMNLNLTLEINKNKSQIKIVCTC